jgi:hypothetical protein
MTEMFGLPQRHIEKNTKLSSLWLKRDGFDANMLPQGLKYCRDHSRALSYRGGGVNDSKCH